MKRQDKRRAADRRELEAQTQRLEQNGGYRAKVVANRHAPVGRIKCKVCGRVLQEIGPNLPENAQGYHLMPVSGTSDADRLRFSIDILGHTFPHLDQPELIVNLTCCGTTTRLTAGFITGRLKAGKASAAEPITIRVPRT